MIDSRILIGLIAILMAIGSVVYVGVNEADRQEEFKQAFAGRSVESGAAMFAQYCSPCHGIKGEGIPGVAPGLNTPEFFNDRLDQLGYQGSLKAFVTLTIAGGRPIKSSEASSYPQNMPTWSKDYGGPLRNDQIDAIASYVLHWGQFYEEGVPGPTPTPMACDTSEECGEILFQNMGCIGCHTFNGEGGAVGPNLTTVIADKGADFVQQSVLNPNAVITEGFAANIMPANFGERMGDAEINNIIDYLTTGSQ